MKEPIALVDGLEEVLIDDEGNEFLVRYELVSDCNQPTLESYLDDNNEWFLPLKDKKQ